MKYLTIFLFCCIILSCDRYRVGPISVSQRDIDRAVDAVDELTSGNDNVEEDGSEIEYSSRNESELSKYGFSDLDAKGSYKCLEYLGLRTTWPNGVSDANYHFECDAYLVRYKNKCNVVMHDCSQIFNGKPYRVWIAIDGDESGCNEEGCECEYYNHRGQYISKCDECGHSVLKHWPKE